MVLIGYILLFSRNEQKNDTMRDTVEKSYIRLKCSESVKFVVMNQTFWAWPFFTTEEGPSPKCFVHWNRFDTFQSMLALYVLLCQHVFFPGYI